MKLETREARASFDAAFLDRAGRVVDVQLFVQGDREGIMPKAEAVTRFALRSISGWNRTTLTGIESGRRAIRPVENGHAARQATARPQGARTVVDRRRGAGDAADFAFPRLADIDEHEFFAVFDFLFHFLRIDLQIVQRNHSFFLAGNERQNPGP